MQNKLSLGAWTGVLLTVGMTASAEPVRVVVSIENLAPARGTTQTPFWVGFHGGDPDVSGQGFDLYDGNTPANSAPQAGSTAMESICEDGDTGILSADFAALVPDGIDATLPGPAGVIAPGDTAIGSFVLDSDELASRYFSYASMLLPSNDFCVANGNPEAHEVFNEAGDFVAENFFITGAEVLDAGTEENDEKPENTAFFGQAAPNTGVDEGGFIGDADDLADFAGFMAPSAGGILADPRFAMGDFTAPGYPIAKISFASAPAIVDELQFRTELSGASEVPPIETRANGNALFNLVEDGTHLEFRSVHRGLRDIVGAHLHLAAEGENGPVVAFLLPAGLDPRSKDGQRAKRFFRGTLSSGDLVGPLSGQPLDALVAQMEAGNVYINLHSSEFPSGQLRGQLELR